MTRHYHGHDDIPPVPDIVMAALRRQAAATQATVADLAEAARTGSAPDLVTPHPYEDEAHDHIWETEDVADGVVGGGLAHVYVTRCTVCDEEQDEPPEPEYEED